MHFIVNNRMDFQSPDQDIIAFAFHIVTAQFSFVCKAMHLLTVESRRLIDYLCFSSVFRNCLESKQKPPFKYLYLDCEKNLVTLKNTPYFNWFKEKVLREEAVARYVAYSFFFLLIVSKAAKQFLHSSFYCIRVLMHMPNPASLE